MEDYERNAFRGEIKRFEERVEQLQKAANDSRPEILENFILQPV